MSAVEKTLDARGLICPLPVLKARKALLALPQGAALTVFVTDANAPEDFRLFCEENNYAFISAESVEQGFKIVIEKNG